MTKGSEKNLGSDRYVHYLECKDVSNVYILM